MKIRLVAIATASVAAAVAGLVGGLASAHADTTAPLTQTSMSQVGVSASSGSAGVINVSRFSDVSFVSPTGRIACHLIGGPHTLGAAECMFPTGSVNSRLPSASKVCGNAGDFNGVGVDGEHSPYWVCATDQYVQPLRKQGNASVAWASYYRMPTATWISRGGNRIGAAAELPYGTTLVSDGMACTMHTYGVVCESLQTHKGFVLSAERVTPIGAHGFVG